MKSIRIAVAAATLGLCTPLAHAQDAVPIHPALHDRFYVGVGAVPKTQHLGALNSSTLGVGTNIDFERALGMTTQKTLPDFFRPMAVGPVAFEAEYFQLNRTGDKVTENQIQWRRRISGQYADSIEVNFFRYSRFRGVLFFRPQTRRWVGFGFRVASYNVALGTATISNEKKF
jgi:hypothetical protein